MAVASSLPANQSVTIFTSCTLSATAPTPLSNRPAAASQNTPPCTVSSPPSPISASPIITTCRSPISTPSRAPGMAITMPGSMYSPISSPTCV